MGHYFWACSTGKQGQCPLLRDDNGAPGKPVVDPKAPQETCPEKGCTQKITRIQSQKNADFFFWKCANPKHPLRKDNNGTPGEELIFRKKN
jgi:DNA topoisomerase-3